MKENGRNFAAKGTTNTHIIHYDTITYILFESNFNICVTSVSQTFSELLKLKETYLKDLI